MDCADNKLETIESFPQGLKELNCECNCLKTLPNFPKTLIKCYTQYNDLVSLPPLNEGLIELMYHKNNVSLDYIPDSLSSISNDIQPPNKFIFTYLETFRSVVEKQRNIKRTLKIKEELMMKVWHPNRIEKLLAMGYDLDIILD